MMIVNACTYCPVASNKEARYNIFIPKAMYANEATIHCPWLFVALSGIMRRIRIIPSHSI
jgi:hypothetical protein